MRRSTTLLETISGALLGGAIWLGAPVPVAGADASFLEVVRRYADTMIERGRDHYGPERSGLLLSALDRGTLEPLKVVRAAPAGIRRGDRPGRPWVAMNGSNPMLDQNLLRVMILLTELTGDSRYGRVVDEELSWFFTRTQSKATRLLPWGEHLSWDVVYDIPISGGEEMMHEFARPWAMWDRCFALAPDASRAFALGLWEHQIANHETGGFDRHAPYAEHGPKDGRDFPRHGAFYIGTWCYAWKHTGDATFLKAIEVILARFERKGLQPDGTRVGTLGPLDLELAASMVPDPLAARLRRFAAGEDAAILPDLKKQMTDGAMPMWENGYSAGTIADQGMFMLGRHDQTGNPAYRELLLAVADRYLGSLPGEDQDVWPLSFAHVISAEVAAHRLTGRREYLEAAIGFSRLAVALYWQDNTLPRASLHTGHYETITGADSLALALLEVHVATHGLTNRIPLNTLDR